MKSHETVGCCPCGRGTWWRRCGSGSRTFVCWTEISRTRTLAGICPETCGRNVEFKKCHNTTKKSYVHGSGTWKTWCCRGWDWWPSLCRTSAGRNTECWNIARGRYDRIFHTEIWQPTSSVPAYTTYKLFSIHLFRWKNRRWYRYYR